ncbi:beta strand repeat-containing protein [Niveispirillum fermenti]|uniref:beta strand repeat-containing protein n=1 Tax=Niveispirillum fermenti TaxID=1233113 RepID=UPI0040432318
MAGPSIFVYNEAYYLAQNPDVAAAVQAGVIENGLQHWQAFGAAEGRKASAFFDWEVYRDNNQDLVEAGLTTEAALTQHFNLYGHNEPRVFLSSAVFDATIYAAQNPDLAVAGVTGAYALERHFVTNGVGEGRVAVAGLDGAAYIDSFADLKALLDAGGNIAGFTAAQKAQAGIWHYYNYGISEGRPLPTPAPVVTITPASTTVQEGADLVFTVKLSVPLTTDTVFTYNITGDTRDGALNAASPNDFTSVTGTVTIPAGSTSYSFTVTPVADGIAEGLEGFKVTLFNQNLVVVKTSDVVGIIDAPAPVVPQTFTLTAGTDNFVGGTANDTFVGTIRTDDPTLSTLNAGDTLNGGSGIDTLTVNVAGSGTGSPAISPTLIGVERVLVSNSASSGTASIDLSLADSALTTVGTTASLSSGVKTEFVGLNKIVDVVARGAGDLTVNFAAGVVAGSGDALNLSLSGVGSSGSGIIFDTNGIETLNISSSGAANSLKFGTGITGTGGTQTINASGAQALTLDGIGGVTTVNGAGLTAALTVSGIGSGGVSITGGAGNDVFDFGNTFNAATGTGNDIIAGGEGTDTLKITSSATNIADAAFANVTSIEVLNVASGGTGTLTLGANAAAAGITTLTESGTGALSLTVASGYTGTLTVNLSGSGNSVSVASGSTANVVVNASVASVSGLTFAGSTGTGSTDTLSVTGTGSVTIGTGVTDIDVLKLTSTGALSVTTSNANVGSGRILSVDASAVSGSTGTGANGLTFDGTAENDGRFSITGSAVNDSITLSSGAHTVVAGAGNDTIDATAGGNVSLDGGAGNDTFVVDLTTLGTGATINGGEGSDTLYVQGTGTVTSANLANVSNVERLVFDGNATLNTAIQFSTFDLSGSTGANTLTLASGYTGATTVTLGSGDIVDNTGARVDLTVNVTAADYVATKGDVIRGGSGSHTVTLNLEASVEGTGSQVVLGTGAYVDVLNIVDGGDVASGTGANAGKDVSVQLASGYSNNIIVNASALDAGTFSTGGSPNADFENLLFDGSQALGTIVATGGAGNDTISGGMGKNTLLGGDGADYLYAGNGGTGSFDSINGGNGDDIIVFTSGNFDGNDTVDGGAGNDMLVVAPGTGGIQDLAFLNVSNIETLGLSGGGTGTVVLDTRAQAAGLTGIKLAATGNFVVNAAGFTNGLTFDATLSTGDVSLTGGAGNDTFVFAGSGLNNSDLIVGGSGTNNLVLSNSGGGVSAQIGTNISGISEIVVRDDATGTGSTAGATITLSGYTGSALKIDASALNATGETLTFTNNTSVVVTVVGGSGNDIITGGSGNDVLSGGAGNDSIIGGAGNDLIVGGAGNDTLSGGVGVDTLTGGDGNDVFVFTPGDNTSTGADVITDFGSGDVIVLKHTVGANASIDANYKGAANTYADALSLLQGSTGTNAGQYVYINSLNQLVIDVDGNGLIQANDLYITLQGTSGFTSGSVALDLTVTGAGSTISGGAADDTITLSGASSATIVGGAGNDTLKVAGSGNTGSFTGGAGTGDAVIFLSGATSGAVTVTTVETVTLASGAGAGNNVTFGATGSSLTVSNLNGTGTLLTVNGSTGADSLTIASGSSGAVGVINTGGTITVTGSDGNDYVAFRGTGGTINLGSGDDTLLLTGASSVTISGVEHVSGATGTGDIFTVTLGNTGSDVVLLGGATGSGATVSFSGFNSGDTIDLGASGGSDTVVFGTGSTGSGPAISNFDAGASGDVLDFSALNDAGSINNIGAAYNLSGTGADLSVGTGDGVVLVYGNGGVLSEADFTGVAGANSALVVDAANKFIVLSAADTTSTSLNVYLVDTSLAGGGATVDAGDVQLIGTINLLTGDNINSFVAGNFGGIV